MVLRFSIRDMFLSLTLISIGFGCFCIAVLSRERGPQMALVILAPPFLGAGLGALNQRKSLGLYWGLLVTVGMVLFSFLFLPTIQAARE